MSDAELIDEAEEFRAYPKSVQPGIPTLGDVPEGWRVLPMRKLLKIVQRPVKMVDDDVYQLVTARRNRGGLVARERLTGAKIATKTQFRVKAGDFVMSRRQIAHGACGNLPPELDGSLVSNEYAVLLPTDELDEAFLRHLPHSIYFQQTCFHSSIGVHVEKLVFNLEHWLTWQFLVPFPAEQRRIAAVLDAWDAAIATAEQLVTAQRRLRVCVEDKALGQGELTRFTDAADVWFSGVDKKIVDGEHRVRLCNYMDVLNNRRLTDSIEYSAGSATKGEAERFALKEGDVVFTKDSETAAEIAEPAYVAEALTGVVCGYHLGIARPKEGVSGAYLTHAIRSQKLRQQFVRRANGAIRFGLTLETMEQVELPLPGLNRQVAIAGALDAVDDEVVRLTALSEMLRQQKRGLMRQLLTGRLRVPKSIDALGPPATELAAAE